MHYRIDLLWQAQSGTKLTLCKDKINELRQFDCYAATLGITKKKVFILDVPSNVKILHSQLKKFRGIEIQAIPGDGAISLVIILLDDSLFSTFCYLIDDIIKSLMPLNSPKDAVLEVFKILRYWRKLFENIETQGLSLELQRGLYGELLFIKELLQKRIDANEVINSWQGPNKKNQDFMFDNLCVEVKSTTANTPVIKISNENQLNSQKELCLILFSLAETRGSISTLPELVNDILVYLSVEYENIKELFISKLALYGYKDSESALYSNVEYSLRFIDLYFIKEDFPKIVPQNIVSGIFEVEYCIERSACIPFLADYPTFIIKKLER